LDETEVEGFQQVKNKAVADKHSHFIADGFFTFAFLLFTSFTFYL